MILFISLRNTPFRILFSLQMFLCNYFFLVNATYHRWKMVCDLYLLTIPALTARNLRGSLRACTGMFLRGTEKLPCTTVQDFMVLNHTICMGVTLIECALAPHQIIENQNERPFNIFNKKSSELNYVHSSLDGWIYKS